MKSSYVLSLCLFLCMASVIARNDKDELGVNLHWYVTVDKDCHTHKCASFHGICIFYDDMDQDRGVDCKFLGSTSDFILYSSNSSSDV